MTYRNSNQPKRTTIATWRPIPCSRCAGRGCLTCRGTGRVVVWLRRWLPVALAALLLTACDGHITLTETTTNFGETKVYTIQGHIELNAPLYPGFRDEETQVVRWQ